MIFSSNSLVHKNLPKEVNHQNMEIMCNKDGVAKLTSRMSKSREVCAFGCSAPAAREFNALGSRPDWGVTVMRRRNFRRSKRKRPRPNRNISPGNADGSLFQNRYCETCETVRVGLHRCPILSVNICIIARYLKFHTAKATVSEALSRALKQALTRE
jgi:hypothetical protein